MLIGTGESDGGKCGEPMSRKRCGNSHGRFSGRTTVFPLQSRRDGEEGVVFFRFNQERPQGIEPFRINLRHCY